MSDTVRVPGIKEPLPKWGVFGGLALTGVAIAVYYRNRKNQAAAAAAGTPPAGLASGGVAGGTGTQGDAYPWDGTYSNPSDPYSMDTATGVTYGDEGYYSGTFPGAPGSGVAGGGAAGPPFSSNATWSAYAIQQLTQVSGESPGPVTEALGLYLNGQPLTTAQQDIVYSAIAVAGNVPVDGPGGYPPKLRAQSSQGNGHKGGKAFAANPVADLKATARGAGRTTGGNPPNIPQATGPGAKGPEKHGKAELEISWHQADHATGYQVSVANVTAHRTALAPVTTARTSYVVRGLAAGDTYRVTVLAKPAEKGAKAATTQVRT